MFRSAVQVALAVAVLAPAGAFAQPGNFQVVEVKVNRDKLTWNETRAVPVRKVVEVTVNVNGMNVVEKREITVNEIVTFTKEIGLKTVKATDGAGKAVDAEKLAEALKDGKPVVVVSGPVAAKHRALFKDSTLFIQLPGDGPPTGVPGPGTAPVVPAVEPGGVPPVILPPGPKSGR